MTSETWRLLPFSVGASAEHIARSDMLARTVRTPTVWWHATDHPTLILGPAQSLAQVDAEAAQAQDVTIVKRRAGGTSVLASPDVLGLDVALPAGHPLVPGDVVEGYRWFGELWSSVCNRLGADVHAVSIAEARAAPPPPYEAVRLACFGTLSPYEVVVNGRKLVGLAQVRRRAGALLQAGIHLTFNAAGLASFLPSVDRAALATALDGAAVGLHEATGHAWSHATVINTFHAVLAEQYDITLVPQGWTPEEDQCASGLATSSIP